MGVNKILVSQRLILEPYGKVNIRVLSTAVNISARWRGDVLHLTVPPISAERLHVLLGEMRPRIMACKPSPQQLLYHNGFTFANDGWRFATTATAALRPGHVDAIRPCREAEPFYFLIRYGADSDLSLPEMQNTIARMVKHVARIVAEDLLLGQGYAEAHRLGISIREGSLSVSRGLKRLGTCRADGRISLSYILMFLSAEQRRSTILHEFAHLTHFNHSPAFYALWDSYLGYPHSRISLASMNLPLPGMPQISPHHDE